MGTQFEALKLSRAADAAYVSIREKILVGQLSPGQRLDVSTVAKQLGVSRTPVKDALQKLSGEGLIEIPAHKGTFVTQLRAADIREIFEVREALEVAACKLLAGHMNSRKADELRRINSRLRKSQLTRLQHIQLNDEFHRVLVASADNSRLYQIYVELSSHVVITRIQPTSGDWRVSVPAALEEHDRIIDALLNQRTEEAEAIVSRHIRRAKELLLER